MSRLIDYFGLTLTFEAIFLLGYRLGRKDGGRDEHNRRTG